MILFYLAAMFADDIKTEKGYLYSVSEKRFVTNEDNNIRLVKRGEMPKKFKIEKMEGGNSGNIFILPVPKRNNYVTDLTFDNDRHWILYPRHGNNNQTFKFSMQPKGQIKIMVDGACINVRDKHYLNGVACSPPGDDRTQLFRWIPERKKWKVKEMMLASAQRNGPGGYESDEGYESGGEYGGDCEDGKPYRSDDSSTREMRRDSFGMSPSFSNDDERYRRRPRRGRDSDSKSDSSTSSGSQDGCSEYMSARARASRARGRRSHGMVTRRACLDMLRAQNRDDVVCGRGFDAGEDSHSHYEPAHYAVNSSLFESGRGPYSALEMRRDHGMSGAPESPGCNPVDAGYNEICRIYNTMSEFRQAAAEV